MPTFLGLDIGTSGAKCVLIDAAARLLGSAGQEYPMLTPQPGWAEQDPQEWLRAAAAGVRRVLQESQTDPRQVAGLGLAGQMHSLVCVGAGGAVLRPAILWADTRSAAQAARLTAEIGRERLAQCAGNPLAAGFMLASWAWLQENEAATAAHTQTLLLPKDYVRLCLTGQLGTEASDASSTLLFDPHQWGWSAPLLAAAGLREDQLPTVHPSAALAGGLLPEFAAACGLSAGLPVVFGGSDQACQAIGQGVVEPGSLTVTIGSGGQLFAPLNHPSHDPELRLHLFCHAAPRTWHLEAAILTAGLALRWLRAAAAPDLSYAELADAAAQVQAAGEGLFFVPHLAGERTPHMDPAARGAFIGLGLNHTSAHLTRAVMEGVVFALRQSFDLMLELGVAVERVIATGGAVRHPLWLQLLANTLGRPIIPAHTSEATGFGAALLAGVGMGAWPTAAAAARTLPAPQAAILPDAQQVERYAGYFQKYRAIYPALHGLRTTD